MQPFDPWAYGEVCGGLLDHVQGCALDAGQPREPLRAQLAGLDAQRLSPTGRVLDPQMADCCLAALWLVHNFLDESHQVSQSIPSASGSYWHGIMHRREGDYGNAKYWMRLVGRHPIHGPLAAEVGALAGATGPSNRAARPPGLLRADGDFDPLGFVDLVQAACQGRGEFLSWCEPLAWAEWRLLFDLCFQRAFTGAG